MKAQLNFLDCKAYNPASKLYLIIDECDNFTNGVLNEEENKIYHAVAYGSSIYGIFKKFTGMSEHIFIIGNSPVTLDDR